MITKLCIECKQEKPVSEFYKHLHNRDELDCYCKTCHRQLTNKWNRKNRRPRQAATKFEVFSHYSGGDPVCARCGFDDIRALSIDHINNDGNKHRREARPKRTRAGVGFYEWLRKNNYPEGFQVLCMNCQFIKVHEVERTRLANLEGGS